VPAGVSGFFEHRRFFRVALPEIGYVRALVEAYDGIAQLRVRDPDRGEVELTIAPGCEDEAEALVQAIAREVAWSEIPAPPDWDDTP
jgi:hypothetical protein